MVATGALSLLEAIRSHIAAIGRNRVHYYQAGSLKMFGLTPSVEGMVALMIFW